MRLNNWIEIIFSKFIKPPHSGLCYRIDNNKSVWEGTLAFTSRYDSIRVKDSFEIRIELPENSKTIPLVKETGGRIEKIRATHCLKNEQDLHVNPNGTICLCPKPEEKRRFPGKVNLRKFVNELVIPYFSELSYFEKTGKWIWGQYSHGPAGIMEYYLDNRNDNDPKLLDDCLMAIGIDPHEFSIEPYAQINGREHCVCGSKLKFKKCHPKALSGFRAIIEDSKLIQKK